MWFSNYVLPVLIAIAVMLVVLWPTERGGHRLLRNWGIPHPRPDQVIGLVAQLGAVVCWFVLANPSRRSLAASRA